MNWPPKQSRKSRHILSTIHPMRHLSVDHNIGCTLDSNKYRLAASTQVVKRARRDGLVYVNHKNFNFCLVSESPKAFLLTFTLSGINWNSSSGIALSKRSSNCSTKPKIRQQLETVYAANNLTNGSNLVQLCTHSINISIIIKAASTEILAVR